MARKIQKRPTSPASVPKLPIGNVLSSFFVLPPPFVEPFCHAAILPSHTCDTSLAKRHLSILSTISCSMHSIGVRYVSNACGGMRVILPRPGGHRNCGRPGRSKRGGRKKRRCLRASERASFLRTPSLTRPQANRNPGKRQRSKAGGQRAADGSSRLRTIQPPFAPLPGRSIDTRPTKCL